MPFISHAANGQPFLRLGELPSLKPILAPENWYLGHLGDYINFPFGTAFFPWAMLGSNRVQILVGTRQVRNNTVIHKQYTWIAGLVGSRISPQASNFLSYRFLDTSAMTKSSFQKYLTISRWQSLWPVKLYLPFAISSRKWKMNIALFSQNCCP